MRIYEGYFNDKETDKDDIISDAENTLSALDTYKYYIEIVYSLRRDIDVVPDFDKNIRRLNYLFQHIPCVSDFYVEDSDKIQVIEYNDKYNRKSVVEKVYFNVNETSNYRQFNKFIYMLKHQIAFCLDCSYPITRKMIDSIGYVKFFYDNGETVLNNQNAVLKIGNYQYETLYNDMTHVLYSELFPEQDDMYKLDTDLYSKDLRQKAFQKVMSQLNDSDDVKDAGIYFNIINVCMDETLKIFVTHTLNYVSMEIHPADKKVKRIDSEELAKIIEKNVLDKIPLNIERVIGSSYIIIKPVDMTVKDTDTYMHQYLRTFDFGNTQSYSYSFPHSQHGAHLVVTKKDGTTIKTRDASSMYHEIIACINDGDCWNKH